MVSIVERFHCIDELNYSLINNSVEVNEYETMWSCVAS